MNGIYLRTPLFKTSCTYELKERKNLYKLYGVFDALTSTLMKHAKGSLSAPKPISIARTHGNI